MHTKSCFNFFSQITCVRHSMVVKICIGMFIILALPLTSYVKMGKLPAESLLQFLVRSGVVLISTYLFGFFLESEWVCQRRALSKAPSAALVQRKCGVCFSDACISSWKRCVDTALTPSPADLSVSCTCDVTQLNEQDKIISLTRCVPPAEHILT